MRKAQKTQIEDIFALARKAHEAIRGALDKEDRTNAMQLFYQLDCLIFFTLVCLTQTPQVMTHNDFRAIMTQRRRNMQKCSSIPNIALPVTVPGRMGFVMLHCAVRWFYHSDWTSKRQIELTGIHAADTVNINAVRNLRADLFIWIIRG